MAPAALALTALLAAPPAPPQADPAARADLDALRALARASADEPPIEAVQAAAARRAAGRDPGSLPGRGRAAALLPRITAEYRQDQRSYRTVGLTGSSEVDYLRLSPGSVLLVRATWELSDLVAPRGELAALSAAADRARRRDEAVRRATSLYFERRRLRVALLLEPPSTPRARADAELEVHRLTAELEALTGGLLAEGTW
jgi:hypothetical protein